MLRREEDGSEVARFSIRDATSKAVEEAALQDYRNQQREPAGTEANRITDVSESAAMVH